MPKEYRIRVRGKQRTDIDIELFAQALLMIIEDLQAEQAAPQEAETDEAEPDS
jgi:hypothetical protein